MALYHRPWRERRARACSKQAVADELIIWLGAVKRHRNTIFGKLGVTSPGEAIDRAQALGLVRL